MQTSVLQIITDAESAAFTKSKYADICALDHEGKINSAYKEDFKTAGPVAPYVIELEASQVVVSKGGKLHKATYKLDTNYKYLTGSTLGLHIPHLVLQSQYSKTFQFRMVENVVYNVAKKAYFRSSNEIVGTLDPYSQDVLYNSMIPPDTKPALDKDMGHTSVCLQWTTEIQPVMLKARQMFGYSLGVCKAWPVHEQKKPSQVYHEYEVCLDVT